MHHNALELVTISKQQAWAQARTHEVSSWGHMFAGLLQSPSLAKKAVFKDVEE